ncbi:MAG: TIM barrel protein, partial [Desulfocapsaceae bacterium]|nr:TIM barrel protein [Desulfocapsaceae bacterium]
LKLGLENPGDGKANVIDTAQEAAPLIDEIALETVGLNYDFGNLISHCFEKVKPEEDYRCALSQTIHYHVKDVVRHGDGWGFSTIGEGMIDYRRILDEIGRDPRTLPVSLEIPLRVTRAADASPIRAGGPVDLHLIRRTLTESMKFVRQILAV